ncbi:Clas4 [Clostera anastomosis granulovirus B]|uniref:Clas4 n=1 Tax=Clostera anastomosis granulovirus B TaxID=1986290 RepID=A0A0K0WSB5_9BBAC|nr:Clas4 [Clostera anastomosis granulovirus B]AKS25347.1 Clas4 [Clostera anastomosis granulovirus B]
MSKIISKKCVAAHRVQPYQIKNVNVGCLQKLYFDWLPQEVYDMIVERLDSASALNLQCAYFRASNKTPIMYDFEGAHLNMFKSVQQIPIKYTQLPRVCNCQEEMEYGDIFICTTCKRHELSYYTVCVDLLGVKKFQIGEELDVYKGVLLRVFFNKNNCDKCSTTTTNSCTTCNFKLNLLNYCNKTHCNPKFCYVYSF